MWRLVGFFLVVLALTAVLRSVPVVGAVFRIPLLGFWITAILVSVAASKLTADALDRRKLRALERTLGAVDTPHHKGKLGALLLTQGRVQKALPLLEAAVAGEPDAVEWPYRLGEARLKAGDAKGARDALELVLARDEEHAYGRAMLLSARACAMDGDWDEALERLARFERNHGPSPESAYRRGEVLRKAGKVEEARAAFGEVSKLAHEHPGLAGGSGRGWSLRASLARLR